MSHSTIYRICLLVVVILTIIGGIFYYVNYVESQVKVTEGTLVREEFKEELPAGCKDARQDLLSIYQYQGQEKAVA